MGTQEAPQLEDNKTEILKLLMQYQGDIYVYNNFSSAQKSQGYHLIEKGRTLSKDNIKAGTRIPIKDIGALVIRLVGEERLEVDFRAKADYFWLRRNLDKVEDELYVESTRAVYGPDGFETTHVTYTDVGRLRQNPETAMHLDLAYLSPNNEMDHDETHKARTLVQQYVTFMKDVLKGAEFLNPCIGPYKLHKLPDKKK